VLRPFGWTLAVVAVAYIGLCILLFVKQRSLLFPAPVIRSDPGGTSRFVEVPNGTSILWCDAGEHTPVVVHFHGNAEQIGGLGALAELLADARVSLAAVEYPGYAGAPGEPSEDSLIAAGQNALEHLTRTMNVAPERIVLSGQSVGSGVAVTLAARGWGSRLVLLTPYTSLPDVAQRALPWFPVRLLMRDTLDSASRAPSIQQRVLIIHGTDDEVVPFDLGRKLAGRFPHARFVAVLGGTHNTVWRREETRSAFIEFVAAKY
jgi:pimeloyl-ACP methyl ester carboxylesterase